MSTAMDNNRTINKNVKRSKKSSRGNSWKIINSDNWTSDHDSDGTTGSIGGNRVRDSSNCSSTVEEFDQIPERTKEVLNLTLDNVNEKVPKNTPQSSTTILKHKNAKNLAKKAPVKKTNKKYNYTHKNNEKIKSMINGLLIATLIIVSSIASGHLLEKRSRLAMPHITTTTLHRYIAMSMRIYKQLIDENTKLRSKVYHLENLLQENSKLKIINVDTEPEIGLNSSMIDHFIKHIEKEMKTTMKVFKNKSKNSTIIENNEDENKMKSSDQHQLKREKFEKNENIAKGENVKNIQGDSNEKETFESKRQRILERLDADWMNNNDVCKRFEYNAPYKPCCNKNGYVYNIRKLFEPNTPSQCSVTLSSNSCEQKPIIENQSKNETDTENKVEPTIPKQNSTQDLPPTNENITETSKSDKEEETCVNKSKISNISQETVEKYENTSYPKTTFLYEDKEENQQSTEPPTTEKNYFEESDFQPKCFIDKKEEIRESKRKPKSRSKERGRRRNRTKRQSQDKRQDVPNTDQ